MTTHEIDVKNQSFGRAASQIASVLRGKTSPAFTPNKLPLTEVIIRNLDKIKFTGAKMQKKIYYRYSGYHGGIRARTLSELWSARPQYVMRQAVYAMLPKNRLRDKIIKNLKFK